jgi:hypothetical protein
VDAGHGVGQEPGDVLGEQPVGVPVEVAAGLLPCGRGHPGPEGLAQQRQPVGGVDALALDGGQQVAVAVSGTGLLLGEAEVVEHGGGGACGELGVGDQVVPGVVPRRAVDPLDDSLDVRVRDAEPVGLAVRPEADEASGARARTCRSRARLRAASGGGVVVGSVRGASRAAAATGLMRASRAARSTRRRAFAA